jgi:hypothetical protein
MVEKHKILKKGRFKMIITQLTGQITQKQIRQTNNGKAYQVLQVLITTDKGSSLVDVQDWDVQRSYNGEFDQAVRITTGIYKNRSDQFQASQNVTVL